MGGPEEGKGLGGDGGRSDRPKGTRTRKERTEERGTMEGRGEGGKDRREEGERVYKRTQERLRTRSDSPCQ